MVTIPVKILIKKSVTLYFVSTLTFFTVPGMRESVEMSLMGTNPQRAYQHLFSAIFVPSSVLGPNSALPPTFIVKQPAILIPTAINRTRHKIFLVFVVGHLLAIKSIVRPATSLTFLWFNLRPQDFQELRQPFRMSRPGRGADKVTINVSFIHRNVNELTTRSIHIGPHCRIS